MSKPTNRPWCIGFNSKTVMEGASPSQEWTKRIALFQDKEDAALAVKAVNLHDEMLAVLRATLESLLPYDKEGNMSAIVIAVCDVIKKAEAP